MSRRVGLLALLVCNVAVWGQAQIIDPRVQRYQQQHQQQHQQQQQQMQQMQQMQQNPMLQQQAQKALQVNLTGVLEGIGGGGLRMTDGQNQIWHVMLQPGVKAQVAGTATADFLAKGTYVEFTANLNAGGETIEEINALTITSHGDDKQPGVYSTEGGVNSSKPLVKPSGPCRVIGIITSPNNDPMVVRAGRTTVKAKLADNPTINVETNDASLAAVGDKISVSGTRAQAKNGNANTFQVHATSVKIEMAQPLTSGKKKTAAKSNTKSTTKSSKKSKDKDGDGKPD